jgi:hypothetical protein
MMPLTLRLMLLLGVTVSLSTSFVSRATKQHARAPSTASYALSERQMQFWEDVDKGLDDIENFFEKNKGQDIDRIRQFTKRYVSVKKKHVFSMGSNMYYYLLKDLYSLFSSDTVLPARFQLQWVWVQATSLPKSM